MLSRYEKKRIDVNSADWTPIVNTEPRDFFSLRCLASALLLRTQVDDPTTEDTLPAGAQEIVGSGSGGGNPVQGVGGLQRFLGSRFPAGGTVCWVKSIEPAATVIVTWVV